MQITGSPPIFPAFDKSAQASGPAADSRAGRGNSVLARDSANRPFHAAAATRPSRHDALAISAASHREVERTRPQLVKSIDELQEVIVHPKIRRAGIQRNAGPAGSQEPVHLTQLGGAHAVSRSQPVQYPPPLYPRTAPLQAVATCEVFELNLSDASAGLYQIERARAKNPRPRIADGLFIYINPVTEPDKVYLMGYVHPLNQGHVSISRFLYCEMAPVYYAGEMKFSQGQMEYFNFASGHYEPPRNYAADYLPFGSPGQRKLLPRSLWRDKAGSDPSTRPGPPMILGGALSATPTVTQ